MTGMEEAAHAIQPKATLTSEQQQPFRSSEGSSPHNAPMQEMKQMEVQFNNPAEQAAMAAEQQRN